MDSDLGKNDPYRGMETGKDEARPEFLKEHDEKNKEERNKSAEENLSAAEDVAESGGFYRPGAAAEEKAGGSRFFAGAGKMSFGKGKSKMKKSKKTAVIAVFVILIVAVAAVVLATPVYMIGTIDYNLQKSLGFTETTAILEKQAEYVTDEMLAEGEVPRGYADDLAASGLSVGQVTASGEFIRTNTYIANIEDLDEVASLGNYQVNKTEDGELAILYDGNVIRAGEFVAAVESNPRMYADYEEALDITARFYYSSDVDKVYKDMGLSRSTFNSWESTGDSEKDMESYYEILFKMLDEGDPSATLYGYDEDISGGDCSENQEACDGSWSYTASGSIVDDLVKGGDGKEGVKSGNVTKATQRAGQLLNSAISSSEPYKAAKAFMAIEEPLNRARAGDNGPVNEVMNSLYEQNEVSYVDVNTGETVTAKKSILETGNFVAAVSGSDFSKAEASNFSRDRIATVTGTGTAEAIKTTTISSNGSQSSNTVTGVESWFGVSPDGDKFGQKAKGSVDVAIVKSNSEVFQTIIGGNRAIEGGSFLSNRINQKVLGAPASDSTAISAYHREVEEVFARQAEADRAKLSPFDISSPNTFLGSIVHNFAQTLIKNTAFSSNGTTAAPVFAAITDMAGSSISGLFGAGATAEGEDVSFTTLSGGNCSTVNSAAQVEGDLYCTAHTTMETGYMHYTNANWGGEPSGYSDYVKYYMDRDSTIGTYNADVCEAYKGEHQTWFGKLLGSVESLLGIYSACNDVSDGIATGSRYTLSSSNTDYVAKVREYSGYTLHNVVYSLLSEKQSTASRILEEYYAEHPRDESAAGELARISGMTKAEAEVALAYAGYLNAVAGYDASTRWAFGGIRIEVKKDLLFEEDEKIRTSLYAVWSKRSEYRDERNRNYTV